MKYLFTFLVLFLQNLVCVSQGNEGYIRFSMQYAESGFSKEELAAMPTESELWFKGDKMKMLLPMGMGLQSSVLVNNDEVHLLLDLMGNRMAIKTNKNEMQGDPKKSKRFKLKNETGEVKDIAGYSCKKAIMAADGEPDMVIWYTDQLRSKGSWYYNMEGINGFPLEFSLKTPELEARMIAKEVKLDKVNDQQFVIPAGYKVMTQEEMMKSLGGVR